MLSVDAISLAADLSSREIPYYSPRIYNPVEPNKRGGGNCVARTAIFLAIASKITEPHSSSSQVFFKNGKIKHARAVILLENDPTRALIADSGNDGIGGFLGKTWYRFVDWDPQNTEKIKLSKFRKRESGWKLISPDKFSKELIGVDWDILCPKILDLAGLRSVVA
jgi:hypothetical protein